jgi:hypothetical protein
MVEFLMYYKEAVKGLNYAINNIDKLKKENKKLIECLKFYANEDRYTDEGFDDGNIYKRIMKKNAGIKARRCLKEIKND